MTVWPFLNFKMLPIHSFYCQDFSSTIIELLFLNSNKTSISLQMYKVRVPQLLVEPSLPLLNEKKVTCELSNEHLWPTAKQIQQYSYTWLFKLWTFCPLWHIIWRWDLPTLQFFNYYTVHDNQQWKGCLASYRSIWSWGNSGKSSEVSEWAPLALHLPGAG